MIREHTYYLPKQRRVRGTRPRLAGFLYAVYSRHAFLNEVDTPGPYDGASHWVHADGTGVFVVIVGGKRIDATGECLGEAFET